MGMKKRWVVAAVGAVMLLALFFGSALAQPTPGSDYGHGWFIDKTADLLGITPETIVEQLQTGKSLAQIAKDKGVDQDTLVDTLIADQKESLNSLVKQRRLTQRQADLRLQLLTEELTELVNRTDLGEFDDWHQEMYEWCHGTVGGGMMGGWGPGMMGGWGSQGYRGMMGGRSTPSSYGGMMGGSWSRSTNSFSPIAGLFSFFGR